MAPYRWRLNVLPKTSKDINLRLPNEFYFSEYSCDVVSRYLDKYKANKLRDDCYIRPEDVYKYFPHELFERYEMNPFDLEAELEPIWFFTHHWSSSEGSPCDPQRTIFDQPGNHWVPGIEQGRGNRPGLVRKLIFCTTNEDGKCQATRYRMNEYLAAGHSNRGPNPKRGKKLGDWMLVKIYVKDSDKIF